ncbi:MAG: chromosomal replication initiator DnaA [Alphaproteobacteria bacterium]|nr:MAG: chromosomal replication initiator DnaA [Alphaproteobacteria bacterium]TAF12504.1 MAG: chromosomal replication initiator DnaA [Alphaproteobacteria bacterium]TAF41287.1 MAG: chromosomal replication initiator DnaA [Alphaproteobacteria bacterium]TAF76278.1 MAG: chromosomal replication initiator DnaA [Alphaproteobacteria bacterium]
MHDESASQAALPLALPDPPLHVVVGDANRMATRILLEDASLPASVVILHGEEGSGKTLLAQLWAQRVQANILDMMPCKGGYYLLDGLELHDRDGEEAMFHAFNRIKGAEAYLLITMRDHPSYVPYILPDLASRMRAAYPIGLTQPDDTMLRTLFLKRLYDKQLRVDEDVVDYCLARIPRSFAALHRVIEQLDATAWQSQRKITKPLVRTLLND